MRKLFDDIVRGRDRKLQSDAITVVLGLLGLVLLMSAYPFGWEMPQYAEF